ncbi:MAG: N-acetylmuramoyl-L-alanine amidase [Candidatus Omnitrophica bacterium]|nr:N-acetylmuramoyl-L-alanine amidase [Candidatus Omnitrophota bacterium]
MKKLSYLILLSVLALTCASCARISPRPPVYAPKTYPAIPPPQEVPSARYDASHVVAPGETVWRLAKMYDVSMESIIEKNKLKKPDRLSIGQKLVIPQAAQIKPVVPLYPSDTWKYIIIHHSATDEGNALCFNEGHKKRGFYRGLGYHFVIDNGTLEKTDGQIEVSPRWLKQEVGAHCKASKMNYRSIGICLVGNFDIEQVTSRQMDSLIYLVRRLKDYYHISPKNILGHGQVRGAKTNCPGKKFPWEEFKRRLTSGS